MGWPRGIFRTNFFHHHLVGRRELIFSRFFHEPEIARNSKFSKIKKMKQVKLTIKVNNKLSGNLRKSFYMSG
jgi:hypothetical protein